MKGFVLSLVALSCTTTFANNTNRYIIKTQILVDGKVVSQPQVVATENEAAEVSLVNDPQNEVKMRVVASDVADEKVKDEILMKFNVEYNSPTRMIKASPQVLMKQGSEATVRLANRQGDHDVQMKVIATRQ